MKFFILIALIFNLTFAIETKKSSENEISVQEVFEIKDDVVLLDVREPHEYKAGRIEGAIFIPLRELKEKIDIYANDKSVEIVIYCLSGPRSLSALRTLKVLGFENVKSMKGGIKSWIKNKLPIER